MLFTKYISLKVLWMENLDVFVTVDNGSSAWNVSSLFLSKSVLAFSPACLSLSLSLSLSFYFIFHLKYSLPFIHFLHLILRAGISYSPSHTSHYTILHWLSCHLQSIQNHLPSNITVNLCRYIKFMALFHELRTIRCTFVVFRVFEYSWIKILWWF